MASSELLSDLWFSKCFSLYPWMTNNISDERPILWMVMKHDIDQVLEFVREKPFISALLVNLPEFPNFVVHEIAIDWVASFCHLIEWH